MSLIFNTVENFWLLASVHWRHFSFRHGFYGLVGVHYYRRGLLNLRIVLYFTWFLENTKSLLQGKWEQRRTRDGWVHVFTHTATILSTSCFVSSPPITLAFLLSLHLLNSNSNFNSKNVSTIFTFSSYQLFIMFLFRIDAISFSRRNTVALIEFKKIFI